MPPHLIAGIAYGVMELAIAISETMRTTAKMSIEEQAEAWRCMQLRLASAKREWDAAGPADTPEERNL